MIDWNLQPIFGSYLAVLILGILSALAFFAIPLDSRLGNGKRWTLNILRLLSILVLLLIALRPGVTLTQRNAPSQSVAIMVDTSASMQLPSGLASSTRWETEQEVVRKINSNRQLLGQDIHWHFFGYDAQLRDLGTISSDAGKESAVQDWNALLPVQPLGVLTDVGKPLSGVLSSGVSPPLMAVVWMGDAAQTTRGDTAEAQQAARQLTQLDIPLYLVGIGPRSNAEQTRDQVLEGIPDQLEAFAKSVIPIRGNLRAIGLQNRELVVRVFLIEPTRPPTLLNQLALSPSQNDQTLPFQLGVTAPAPGAYQLLVKAEGVDGEATLLNNEQTCFLNVPEVGSRVLYLEGQPRQEQKFIRRALADSRELQIDARCLTESTRRDWPIDVVGEWSEDLYDCVVIGDVDAEALGSKTLSRIVELVQGGVGLILLGGYHAYGSGGYEQTPLASILPVEMAGQRQLFGRAIDESGHWSGEIPITVRARHPITELGIAEGKDSVDDREGPEASNATIAKAWSGLKPLDGANRWKGVREGPGIQILAVGADSQPLIVTGEAGKGRILCLAFDSTYRWWRQGKSDLHRQFWRQAVYWAMRREETEEGMKLEMPKRTLALGESSPYVLRWTPGSKKAAMPSDIDIRWSIDGEDRGPLIPQPTDRNAMQGQIVNVSKPGRYEITARTKNSSGMPLESRLPFMVVDMAIEKLAASPDWQLMSQLAKLNEPAGGRIVAPEAIDEVLQALAERRRSATIDSVRTLRLGEGNIDSWVAFLVIAFLWSVQWALRKAWNLP